MTSPREILAPAERPGRAFALCLAVAAICYANSLRVPFQFDDFPVIAENPTLRSWPAFFAGAPGNRWVPQLTFAVQARLHALDPAWLHVGNVAIHAVNGWLVFLLVAGLLRTARGGRREAGDSAGAAAAAAVFLVHPVQTQAVTYLVQRHASLATLFYLATLVLYARARRAGGEHGVGWSAYAPALAAALLATRSKEIALTIPVAISTYEALFGSGPVRRRLALVVPFVAIALVIPAAAVLGSTPTAPSDATNAGDPALEGPARAGSSLTRWEYLLTQLPIIARYLRLLLWPAGQTVEWDVPVHRAVSGPVAAAALLIAATLAIAIALGARARRRGPPEALVASFGAVFFFVALSVESSVIPIKDLMVEHRLYLPSVGVFACTGALVAWTLRRFPAARRAVGVAVATVCVSLAAATVARNRIWADATTLWGDAVEKSPGSARAHYNFGNARLDDGDLAGAEREWREAVRLEPGHSWALGQLGTVALSRGDVAGAVQWFERALAAGDRNPAVHYNLAVILEGAGELGRARAEYEAFLATAGTSYEAEREQVRGRLALWPR